MYERTTLRQVPDQREGAWLRDEQVDVFLPPDIELLVEKLGITKMEGKQPSVAT